jgi:hypothetical protein
LKLELCFLSEGNIDEAYEYFRRASQLNIHPQRYCAPFKLSHDIDQMRHLYARGVAGDDIRQIIAAYESVRDSLPRKMLNDHQFALDSAQRAKLAPNYDNACYLPACPQSARSTLGSGVKRKEVEHSYFNATPNYAVVDNLLSHDALLHLRAFCREATIWNGVTKGYLGTYLLDGFCEPLFLQIAHELRQALPAILADYPLIEMWAYKCDQNLSGLNKHADYAAVNINFWISPDDANIDPESGGLAVYKDEAPP